MAAVPQELIIEDILSILPVKLLLRFKTASKKSYSLISEDYKFAKFHLKQSSYASKSLIIYQLIPPNGGIFQSSDVDIYESRLFNFPVEIEAPCQLIGSANGLICVATHVYYSQLSYYFLWNPCTGECRRIPVSYPAVGCRLFGFGYDSISDDYKILGDWDSNIRVFSLKRNTWKKLEYSVKSPLTLMNYLKGALSALYSNGALLWYVGQQITAFDLANEQIRFLDLPEEIKFVGFHWFSCVPLFNDYQGLLCVSWSKSIWMMKEYGNSKSWDKLSTSLSQEWEYAKPVGISKLGEVVFRTDVGLMKSDIQGNMCGNDKLKIINLADAFVYKESVISPRCFDIIR